MTERELRSSRIMCGLFSLCDTVVCVVEFARDDSRHAREGEERKASAAGRERGC